MTTATRRPERVRALADLTLDSHNANRGTDRGRQALEDSLRRYGAGLGVLVDKHGVVIAGNKTVAEAEAQGLRLRVVDTDGSELVAVQRRDLDLATDRAAQALAIADNRVGELDLDWDTEALEARHAAGVGLSTLWTDEEFATLVAQPTTGRTDENAVVGTSGENGCGRPTFSAAVSSNRNDWRKNDEASEGYVCDVGFRSKSQAHS